jgi:hypothetical protein
MKKYLIKLAIYLIKRYNLHFFVKREDRVDIVRVKKGKIREWRAFRNGHRISLDEATLQGNITL